jgi:hypothetical protein
MNTSANKVCKIANVSFGNYVYSKMGYISILLKFLYLKNGVAFPHPKQKPYKDGVRTKFSIGLSQLYSKSDGRT